MPLRIPCRARETTTSTGTGAVSLSGALSAILQTLITAGNGNRVPYYIVDTANGQFERGIGTLTTGTPVTLSRDFVLESTNSGSAVNFGSGTKDVFIEPHPELVAGPLIDVVAKAADFSVVMADFATLFNVDASSAAVAVTLPLLSSVWVGYTVAVRVGAAGYAVTVSEHASDGGAVVDTLGLLGGVAYFTKLSGTEWAVSGRSAGNAGLQLGAVRVVTSSGTWNHPPGLRYLDVTVQGGGGGGGGGNGSFGGSGGGAGGRARKRIAAASLGGTETRTVGAAGASGTAGNNGGTGGTTSFGAHCSGTGGSGGGANGGSGGAGGSASGGDINVPGAPGITHPGAGTSNRGTNGASSLFGGGGAPGASASANGAAASGYGAGGGGAATNAAGGAGSAGVIIEEEWF